VEIRLRYEYLAKDELSEVIRNYYEKFWLALIGRYPYQEWLDLVEKIEGLIIKDFLEVKKEYKGYTEFT